jgi:hypothetical protein
VTKSVQQAGGLLPRDIAFLTGQRRLMTLALAIVMAGTTGGLVAVFAPGAPGALAATAAGGAPASGLRVVSVSPGRGAGDVNGTDPVSVEFSAPLAAGSPVPRLRPSVPGSWSRYGATLLFSPAVPFAPAQAVTLQIPGGPSGVRAADGGVLARRVDVRFRTQGWSALRLEQLLAQLRYLPLSWHQEQARLPAPATRMLPAESAGAAAGSGHAAELAAAYNPPPGTFKWRQGYPVSLRRLWRPGKPNLILTGAVMAFESQHAMPLDHTAGPRVWAALLRAAAKRQHNAKGYTYALARKGSPETLTVWHNGSVVLKSLANTGIAASPTADGTFPVYLRFQFTIMRGINPDGSHYSDPVWWVSYFNGGDAVHYFSRATYGWPQSLGCVELPWAPAKKVWPYLTYGSLVSVVN